MEKKTEKNQTPKIHQRTGQPLPPPPLTTTTMLTVAWFLNVTILSTFFQKDWTALATNLHFFTTLTFRSVFNRCCCRSAHTNNAHTMHTQWTNNNNNKCFEREVSTVPLHTQPHRPTRTFFPQRLQHPPSQIFGFFHFVLAFVDEIVLHPQQFRHHCVPMQHGHAL